MGPKSFFRLFSKHGDFSTTERARSRRYTKASLSANLASESLRDDTRKLTTRQIAFRDCRCREGTTDSNEFGRRPSRQRHPSGFAAPSDTKITRSDTKRNSAHQDTKSRVRDVTEGHENATAGGNETQQAKRVRGAKPSRNFNRKTRRQQKRHGRKNQQRSEPRQSAKRVCKHGA